MTADEYRALPEPDRFAFTELVTAAALVESELKEGRDPVVTLLACAGAILVQKPRLDLMQELESREDLVELLQLTERRFERWRDILGDVSSRRRVAPRAYPLHVLRKP